MAAPSVADGEVLARAIDRLLEADRIAKREKLLAPLEDTMAAGIRRGFRRQGTAFLKALEALKQTFPADESARLREAAVDDWAALWDQAAESGDPDIVQAIDAGAGAALVDGGTSLIASLGVDSSFNLSNPRAVRYLDQLGAQRVSGIDETSKARLGALIRGGVQEGLGYEKIAALLRDQIDNWAEPQAHVRDRAVMIAITEVGDAYEAGNIAVIHDLQDQGLEYEKNWLAEGSACDICAGNQDAGWVAVDDSFPSGDDTPTAHPGCGCATSYRRVGTDGEGDAGSD